MSSDFFPDLNYDSPTDLNREIDDLYEEVESLHDETGMLLGLMSGSFGFFLKHLITAHQGGDAIAPEDCEQMVIDALRRVLSTQHKFNYDLISEIRDVMLKMDESGSFARYLDKAVSSLPNS